MNTIEKLGDEETFRNIVEHTITEFEDSEIKIIGDYAFYFCSKLTSVSLPVATNIGSSAFDSCSSLTSISFPVAAGIEYSAFASCEALASVSLPAATSIGSYAFSHCYALTSVSFPLATSIESYAFGDCIKLTTMYIGTESNTVCTLSSTDAIPSSVTDIYVPVDLLDSYKTATNWSSFADKIQSYEVPVSCQSLTITADNVAAYQTSTTIHYEAVCTYSIEGIMQTGTKVFKGDAVSDTFGTNPSGESSRQVEVSYTFLGKTATATITQSKHVGDPLGGTIFYIDDTADGVYEFYDAEGNVISSVAVGDSPAMYKVLTPGTKDKYYVYHDEMYTPKIWTYYKDGAYVYDTIGSLGVEIGRGKTNTATMMARDNGAYVTADSNGTPTIWYQLQLTRQAKAGGCDDWFIPSKLEIEELRKAGLMESEFKNKYIWSSSEYSSQTAWTWNYYGQYWYDTYKENKYSVFFARAF